MTRCGLTRANDLRARRAGAGRPPAFTFDVRSLPSAHLRSARGAQQHDRHREQDREDEQRDRRALRQVAAVDADQEAV